MNIDNLTLANGLSFETIVKKLAEGGVPYEVESHPELGDSCQPYFRHSRIRVGDLDVVRAEDAIGVSHGNRNSKFYYAEYEVSPEFDLSKLDGKITFKNGRLVERTVLSFRGTIRV
jgi:hypothetical protein